MQRVLAAGAIDVGVAPSSITAAHNTSTGPSNSATANGSAPARHTQHNRAVSTSSAAVNEGASNAKKTKSANNAALEATATSSVLSTSASDIRTKLRTLLFAGAPPDGRLPNEPNGPPLAPQQPAIGRGQNVEGDRNRDMTGKEKLWDPGCVRSPERSTLGTKVATCSAQIAASSFSGVTSSCEATFQESHDCTTLPSEVVPPPMNPIASTSGAPSAWLGKEPSVQDLHLFNVAPPTGRSMPVSARDHKVGGRTPSSAIGDSGAVLFLNKTRRSSALMQSPTPGAFGTTKTNVKAFPSSSASSSTSSARLTRRYTTGGSHLLSSPAFGTPTTRSKLERSAALATSCGSPGEKKSDHMRLELAQYDLHATTKATANARAGAGAPCFMSQRVTTTSPLTPGRGGAVKNDNEDESTETTNNPDESVSILTTAGCVLAETERCIADTEKCIADIEFTFSAPSEQGTPATSYLFAASANSSAAAQMLAPKQREAGTHEDNRTSKERPPPASSTPTSPPVAAQHHPRGRTSQCDHATDERSFLARASLHMLQHHASSSGDKDNEVLGKKTRHVKAPTSSSLSEVDANGVRAQQDKGEASIAWQRGNSRCSPSSSPKSFLGGQLLQNESKNNNDGTAAGSRSRNAPSSRSSPGSCAPLLAAVSQLKKSYGLSAGLKAGVATPASAKKTTRPHDSVDAKSRPSSTTGEDVVQALWQPPALPATLSSERPRVHESPLVVQSAASKNGVAGSYLSMIANSKRRYMPSKQNGRGSGNSAGIGADGYEKRKGKGITATMERTRHTNTQMSKE
ncbi:unnamed protein product [Amoebophrya sp. A120]|nr:unnamed protein product [Amoebophrya sp. A120]|eukprot:GSA120T00020358001.1